MNDGPALLAVTIDHGLRPQARAEAEAVKRLAKQCGVAHRIMGWTGPKPASGLQQAARAARYRLLAEAAAKFGADTVVTAHTLDDQAETLLMRMSRGSGITGLGGMTRVSPLPGSQKAPIRLVRPFLDLPKARLVATVTAACLDCADDPSNRDPRFTRSRIRSLMPAFSREGLTSARLGQLARRLQRVEAALEVATDAAWRTLAHEQGGEPATVLLDHVFATLPQEVQLRLLGRAIAQVGDEGPVELAKLEALYQALACADGRPRVRRTLAGAMVTRDEGGLTIERAPARRRSARPRSGKALNQRPTLPPQSGQTAVE
jgi:tRNA(Ile)-lysidine synthase